MSYRNLPTRPDRASARGGSLTTYGVDRPRKRVHVAQDPYSSSISPDFTGIPREFGGTTAPLPDSPHTLAKQLTGGPGVVSKGLEGGESHNRYN